MGVLNQNPQLGAMFADLDRRIRALEAVRRFTIPVVPDYTKFPAYPQSGDCVIDASTGYLYVFLVLAGLGYQGLTSVTSNTIGTGSKTFAMTNTGSFQTGDPIRFTQTGSTTNYMAGFISSITTNSSITVNVTTTGGSGTFAAWTAGAAGAWRQIATYADFISAGIYFSTSSGGSAIASAQSVAGGGSGSATSGSTVGTGGTGYLLASGYAPH
jgi:hypothetical protein